MNNCDLPNKAEALEDSGKWNSIDDALKAMYSLSRITKGSDVNQLVNLSRDDLSGVSDKASNSSVQNCQNASEKSIENPEAVDEDSSFGAGRGKLLRELEKQFSRQQLDEKIHADLRAVVGPGFSNELIEHHFGSPSSSVPPTDHVGVEETGIFSDCDYEDEGSSCVTFEVGDSDILKKLADSERLSTLPKKKKKIPRCRNALILSLAQKKSGVHEAEIDPKTKGPLLKGPEVFLPSKSYSTVVSASKDHSSPDNSGPSLFSVNDFPAL